MKTNRKVRRIRPAATWRGLVSAREWTEYRLSVYRSNLAIGALLRELRVNGALTQEQIATQLRVTSQAISGWESGRYAVPETREQQYRKAVVNLIKRAA